MSYTQVRIEDEDVTKEDLIKILKSSNEEYEIEGEGGEFTITIEREKDKPTSLINKILSQYTEVTYSVSDPFYLGYVYYDGEEEKSTSVDAALKEFLKEDWWLEECLDYFEVSDLNKIDSDNLEEWVIENYLTDISDIAFNKIS
jgi:hypothetical protein